MMNVLFSFASVATICFSIATHTNEVKKNQDERTEQRGLPNETVVSFAESNTRFSNDMAPAINPKSEWTAAAWKGEKIHTQLLIWTPSAIDKITVAVSDLKDRNGNTISKKNITTGFVQYVMTDEFKDGCGYRKPSDFDSSWVADIINTQLSSSALAKNTTQPLWVSVTTPRDAKTGLYTGTISVMADKEYRLKISVNVINRLLPSPAHWKYDLDLWQHPAAIARVHKVALWSDAHFAAMKKYYTMLANAGQKTITASIVNEPWGHQTYDDYPSLIKWTKKKNGKWSYDYSLFDRYISFVMSCGIKGRINCYSMVPWKIAFSYYDEALQKDTVLTDAIGTPGYNVFWSNMLVDFTKHLKEKKWFALTSIAMDERPMEAMQAVIALLKKIDTGWKIALAGNYHPEIENDVYNYCIASALKFPDDVLKKREEQGKISTWYTCCTENFPNGFTFSPPDEHVWMGWYTAAKNMDGYLRWAYNSWTKDPLTDSRYTAWPAGDTYQVYPGPLSSIRFEKMIEGIQDFEKIEILRSEYKQKKQTEKLDKLETALKEFEIKNLATETAGDIIKKYKNLLVE